MRRHAPWFHLNMPTVISAEAAPFSPAKTLTRDGYLHRSTRLPASIQPFRDLANPCAN